MTPIKVLIVDDQRLIRQGIRSLLEANDEIEVIDTAENGQQALLSVENSLPDVVLMDIRMPIMDGITATHLLLEKHPGLKIIMLTTFDDEEYIKEPLKAGAVGYLLKDLEAESLYRTIATAQAGLFQFSEGVGQQIIAQLQKPDETTPAANQSAISHYGLTHREIDVLRLIATGSTNKEIAEKLVISENTVKNHVSNILSRLNARDRVQLVIFARDHHIG